MQLRPSRLRRARGSAPGAHPSCDEFRLGARRENGPGVSTGDRFPRSITASVGLYDAAGTGLSTRWARIYEPSGYGDELRSVFRSGATPWGHACLTRWAGEPWFSAAEVDLVARLSPHIGHGIRTALLLAETAGATADGPALVVLDDAGVVESVTPQALDWLGPVDDPHLATTIVLHEVAQQARALAEQDTPGSPARARTRSLDGTWLIARGARLGENGHRSGRTAVVLEPARRSETLRGHVKAVFAKLGVSSRVELAARLSHDPG